MSGSRRERLQTSKSGCSFAPSLMNDFPIPEDPPVMTTEVNDERASRSEDTAGEAATIFQSRRNRRLSFNQTIPRNMNSPNHHEVIVSGIHLELTPSLKTFVREKAERLFRHEERLVRIRVELECDRSPAAGMQFRAKGHIQIHGPDLNACVQA